jgi:hypothetical protein
MADSRLVFSTDSGSHKKDKAEGGGWTKASGPTKMRLETAGRGGKSCLTYLGMKPKRSRC